jgi:hypothetical protein
MSKGSARNRRPNVRHEQAAGGVDVFPVWPPGIEKPNPRDLPALSHREGGVAVMRNVFGTSISPRSLERWPLTWRQFNGRAYCSTVELLNVAAARLCAQPAIRSGRRAVERFEDRAA